MKKPDSRPSLRNNRPEQDSCHGKMEAKCMLFAQTCEPQRKLYHKVISQDASISSCKGFIIDADIEE